MVGRWSSDGDDAGWPLSNGWPVRWLSRMAVLQALLVVGAPVVAA
jgi:hypothetical protein